MPEKDSQDKDFLSSDASGAKQLHLDILIRTLIQRCMGKAIDYGRLSGMGDRSFQQFERTMKDDFYRAINDGIAILEQYGYLDKKDQK